jgi:hypothetical protein
LAEAAKADEAASAVDGSSTKSSQGKYAKLFAKMWGGSSGPSGSSSSSGGSQGALQPKPPSSSRPESSSDQFRMQSSGLSSSGRSITASSRQLGVKMPLKGLPEDGVARENSIIPISRLREDSMSIQRVDSMRCVRA